MSARSSRAGKLTDFEKAMKQAAREKRDLFRHKDDWFVDTAAKELAARVTELLREEEESA